MTLFKKSHIALAESFCSRATIPAISQVALKVAHVTMVWNDRTKARRILRNLDKARVHDLGLTTDQIYLEARKPFWKG